jgi:hypothetical protein
MRIHWVLSSRKLPSPGLTTLHSKLILGKLAPMKKVIYIAAGLAIAVLGYLVSQGLWRSVTVEQGMQGGFILLGIDHTGPYHTIGDAFQELQELYPDGAFSGIYFDNPDSIPSDSLHSFAGLKVSAAQGLEEMGKHHHLRMHNVALRPAHFVNWESGRNMVGILLGTFKAYPALGEACESAGWTGNPVIAYEEYTEDGVRFVMQY